MSLRERLDEKGRLYVGLLVVSTVGIAFLIAVSALKLAGSSFEPIVDPAIVAVVVVFAAVAAGGLSRSDGNANGG